MSVMISVRQLLLPAILLALIACTLPEPARGADLPKIPIVFVSGGCYPMGDQFGDGGSDEKPVHEVCVSDFYLAATEVTEAQWKALMSDVQLRQSRGPDFPASGVSWLDAKEFIRRLNERTGLDYRLPTEAEWEFASRGGGKQQHYAGITDEARLGEYAWYDENCTGIQPVGKKRPNELGIYDLAGNVWEWVQDRYDPVYYRQSPRKNPQGDPFGINRVLRGGSCSSGSGQLRASYRDYVAPEVRADGTGFRLLLPSR